MPHLVVGGSQSLKRSTDPRLVKTRASVRATQTGSVSVTAINSDLVIVVTTPTALPRALVVVTAIMNFCVPASLTDNSLVSVSVTGTKRIVGKFGGASVSVTKIASWNKAGTMTFDEPLRV